MAEHAQIDIRKGKQIARIHHGWGVPRQVIATLRKVAGMGCTRVRSVANKYMEHVPDASFGLELIPDNLGCRHVELSLRARHRRGSVDFEGDAVCRLSHHG
jgi:hypothetical protein